MPKHTLTFSGLKRQKVTKKQYDYISEYNTDPSVDLPIGWKVAFGIGFGIFIVAIGYIEGVYGTGILN